MINKKRILAPLFTFAMAASIFTANAFAEETASPAETPVPAEASADEAAHLQISVEEEQICVGDTVLVTISNKDMEVNTVTGGISYDKETFDCIAIEEDKDAAIDVISTKEQASESGTVGFAKIGTEKKSFQAANLVTVTFKAKKTGDANFTLYEDTDDGSDAAYQNDSAAAAAIQIQGTEVKEEAAGTLKDTLKEAAAVTNEDGTYTAESYKALTDAIEQAKKITEDPDATTAQINAAIKAVADAKAALKKASDVDPSDSTDTQGKKFIQVKKIKITGISKKIAAGKKIKLKATVTPKNAVSKKVTWKSSNKKWATVNAKGVVTLKKAGKGKTVTITATAKDGSKKKALYKIKIMKGVVKKVTIKGKAAQTVKAGKKIKLKAVVKATKGANKKLKWTTSNKKYAKVNSKGVVTTLKAGKGQTVKITAMATDGSGKKKTIKIKIK